MHIVFANSRPALPFFFDGGAERTTFALVSGLTCRGIKITQISTFPRDNMHMAEANANSLGISYIKQPEFRDNNTIFFTKAEHLTTSDNLLKIIAVSRSEFETVCHEIVSQSKPDILVTWLDGSEFIIKLGDKFNIPTVLRVVGPYGSHGYPPLSTRTTVLANSPLTAQICSDHYGQQVNFLLGIVNHSEYVAQPRTPKFVTYINPRKEKGIHLFCKIAALLPEIPFLVVQGWSRTNYQQDELQAIEFLKSLPNITMSSPIADMKQVYSVASILLLPSRWAESWSRVIGEAQANGIPVIASDRGCSPHNIGLGGIILDYKDPHIWASAVRLLYKNDSLMPELSNNARLNINRFHPQKLLKEYENFFSTVLSGNRIQKSRETNMIEIFRGQKDSQGKLKLSLSQIPMWMDFDVSEPNYP